MRERRSSAGSVLERRRAPRHPLRVDARYSFAESTGAGTTEDLTVEGCFLRSDTSVPLGAAVEVALDLPDGGGPVEAAGRVVRVARRMDDPLGFAVEFECLDDSARARIAALVELARVNLMARHGI